MRNKTDNDLFWEEMDSDFEDYAFTRENQGATDKEIQAEKLLVDKMLGREVSA